MMMRRMQTKTKRIRKITPDVKWTFTRRAAAGEYAAAGCGKADYIEAAYTKKTAQADKERKK